MELGCKQQQISMDIWIKTFLEGNIWIMYTSWKPSLTCILWLVLWACSVNSEYCLVEPLYPAQWAGPPNVSQWRSKYCCMYTSPYSQSQQHSTGSDTVSGLWSRSLCLSLSLLFSQPTSQLKYGSQCYVFCWAGLNLAGSCIFHLKAN